MASELNPVIQDFGTVASDFFTSRKLEYFDKLADKYEPDVKTLDPNSINLTPITSAIDALESETKAFVRKLKYTNGTVNDQLAAGSKLLNDSSNVNAGTRRTLENIQNSIYDVQKLADSFDASDNTRAELAIAEASEKLDALRDFTIDTEPSKKSLAYATNYLDDIEDKFAPIEQQKKKLDSAKENMHNFTRKLDDLNKNALEAMRISNRAAMLHSKNMNAAIHSKIEAANNHTKETRDNIEGTTQLAKSGNITLGEIFRFLKNLDNVNNILEDVNKQVDKDIEAKKQQYEDMDDLIAKAVDHRAQLVESVIYCLF